MYKGERELKRKDQTALTELKERLEDLVEQDRRKLGSNFYLFQWLRAHGMNVNKTEQTIRNSFRWREENNITDAYEDFPSDFLPSFPIYDDSFGKTGIRVYTVPLAQWDIKSALENGDEEKLRRYSYLRTLMGENEWLDHNEKLMEKRGVDIMYKPEVIHFIIDAKNIQIDRLVVPLVLESFFGTITNLGSYFPGSAIELILINFTTIFSIVFKIIRPFLTFASKIQIFNSNENQWKKELFKFIDPTQLRPQFGGTKSEGRVSRRRSQGG